MSDSRAVFLDRDGTLIAERHYLHDPAQVELFPGAGAALKRLQDAGFLLLVVTNQSGIGRGLFTLEEMHRVHARLLSELARDQVQIERIYFAPEAPGELSRGRKPSPQFLFDARDEFHLDLARCYLVGDKLIDLECGWNAGVRMPLLVRTGYGAEVEQKLPELCKRAVVCEHLTAVADWILADSPRVTRITSGNS
jgi:D-glycero-D-manno-heptose 1,7-bisphosphate phosphatase